MKGKKLRYVYIVLLVFLNTVAKIQAVPVLEIKDYLTPAIFNRMNVVLIQKGDNREYKEIDFDDSLWKVISLPSDWDDLYKDYNGVCWYRIHIHFPEFLPGKSIGISLGIITDADEVYFNEKLIGTSGQIEPVQKSAYDKLRIYEIPASIIRPGADNLLAMRIKGLFSYQNGPYFGDFRIDTFEALQKGFYIREFFDMFFIITYVIVSIYFLLFFLRRTRDKENLLFSLFSSGMAVYFFLRTQLKYFLGIEFFILKKVEYLVLCWLVLFIIEFLVFYFKKKHTVFHYIYWGCTLISFFTIVFTKDYVFWDKFNQFFMIPSWVLGVVLGIWIIVSRLKKDIDARLMIIPFLLLLCTFTNDILVNMGVYSFTRLTNYGFLFLISSIAIILSNRFVRLHYEVEDLNINLEKKVDARTGELNMTVNALEKAKAETDNILRNVKEGIFLINADFTIGSNYSTVLEQIFETRQLAEQNFVSLLENMIARETITAVQDFLSIIFTRQLTDKRLKKLNPLDDVQITIQKNGKMIKKFLNFAFTRIKDKEENTYILAIVRDMTETKVLARQIEESKQKAEDEMQLLFGILHVNPRMLKRFIQETHEELKHVEELLEEARFSGDLKGLLKNVYRDVHSIKGNAGILGLELFARKAHDFEEKIKDLHEKENLTPLDLVGLLYPIVDLKEQLNQVEKTLSLITSFEKSFGKADVNDQELLAQTLHNLAQRVADREQKKVSLITGSFSLQKARAFDFSSIKKILIQLVKNAITHGIEQPDERKAGGKPETGTIEVESFIKDDAFIITVRDDGRGIQLKSIRKAAVESGKYSHGELERMTVQKLVQLIFEPGITTQKLTSVDAGRGVGLDVVRHELEKMGGKIKLSYKSGEYAMFSLSFPLKKEER